MALADREFAWPGVAEFLYSNSALLSLVGPLTILFQVGFPFFYFLNDRSRAVVVGVAVLFHLCIGVFLGLVSFALIFIAAECAMLADADYRRLATLANKARCALGRTLLACCRSRGVHDDRVA